MKKILLFCFLFSSILIHSQSPLILSEPRLSPNGALENVFDRFGNKSKLSDVLVGKTVKNASGVILRSTSPTPVTAGYFNLYFESGSGMNNWATNATEAARKNILVQVFSDISNFITSPLTTSGKKVNIWVRNIANIPNTPTTVAGLASSFYTAPYNTTTGFGGIIDAEIWKTIHLGKDSYTNTVSPLAIDPANSNASATGYFYHGMVAFRFTGFSWNTNLSATSITNLDLYSIALHEVTHALGFASLIGNDGKSKLGAGFNYYTRYDLKLKNSANTNALITNTGACNSMYNYSFNSALNTSILVSTVCANAIKYVGSSTVSVYTPSVFQDGGSLSHYGPCTAGNFVMAPSIGNGIIRRFFTQQEKNALVEMGYTVSGSYGNATIGMVNYTGSNVGISVSGMNDGIGTNGLYSYTFVEGSIIPLTINSSTNSAIRILANDVNGAGIPTGFECLQDITDPTSTTTVTPSSGTTTTNVTFTSTVTGLHLLRYVPINSSGQKGNITYIYVNVEPSGSCGTATACNLVKNGDFEQRKPTIINSGLHKIDDACGWTKGNNSTPDYFNNDYPLILNYPTKVPCNFVGYQLDKVANNKAYGGLTFVKNSSWTYSETIKTNLTSSLLPNTSYQLSFDLSLAEGSSANAVKMQAYLSENNITYPSAGEITISNSNMLSTDSSFTTVADDWKKVIFNFTTGATAGQKTLYIGGLKQFEIISKTPAPQGVGGCNYLNGNANTPGDINSEGRFYYFIDNVSLIALNGTFNITPNTICTYQSLSDLRVYLSGLPTNGVFSGPGVSYSGGFYSFYPGIAGTGLKTITYTYLNSSGCNVSVFSNITVNTTSITANDDDFSGTPLYPSEYTPLAVTENDSGNCFIWAARNRTLTVINDGGLSGVVFENEYLLIPDNAPAGTYFITYNLCTRMVINGIINNFCDTAIVKIIVVNNSNKIKPKNLSSNIFIYPNPALNTVTVKGEQFNVKKISIIIFDVFGKQLYNNSFNVEAYFDLPIDTSQIPDGIYILEIQAENYTQKKKLIINKNTKQI